MSLQVIQGNCQPFFFFFFFFGEIFLTNLMLVLSCTLVLDFFLYIQTLVNVIL